MSAATHFLFVTLASAACAAAGGVSAQPVQPGEFPRFTAMTDSLPWLTVMPQLKDMPAPEWVKPGTRMMYAISGAVAGMVGHNNPGGASGAGFLQVDITAVEKGVVALDSRTWATAPGEQHPTIAGFEGKPFLPAAGGDYWVHPGALAELVDRPIQPVRAVRLDYPLAGKTVAAIRLESGRAVGEVQSWTFDATSGVLILHTFQAQLWYRGRHVQHLIRAELVGVRHIAWPGADEPMPEWVAKTRALNLAGKQRYTGMGQVIDFPATAKYTFAKPGAGFVPYRQSFVVQQGPLVTHTVDWDRTGGSGAIGGLWMSPKTLAALKPSTVLDDDSVTGIRTMAGKPYAGPGGRTYFPIGEFNRATLLEYTYDTTTGMLVAFQLDQKPTMSNRFTLQGVE
ncbi:MAG: hypothetical protein ACAI43_07750 [Phycisphaerae bacterium]|nr:hypothetical protein [Tepidisphaeraceae bacterium]